jgi:hypothetical protein
MLACGRGRPFSRYSPEILSGVAGKVRDKRAGVLQDSMSRDANWSKSK